MNRGDLLGEEVPTVPDFSAQNQNRNVGQRPAALLVVLTDVLADIVAEEAAQVILIEHDLLTRSEGLALACSHPTLRCAILPVTPARCSLTNDAEQLDQSDTSGRR